MSLLSAVLGGGDGLDPDATLLIKKLGKRDTISKVKALGELREALEAHCADWSAALLPHWVILFCRLADDGSWQVREQTCSALNLFAQQVRRQLAPYLKQIIAPWLRCRFDPQENVRRAAMAAFTSAFPGDGKYSQALAFCQEDLVRSLGEAALAPPAPRPSDEEAAAEATEAYKRLVLTALQALAHVIGADRR